jgi:hypothetical protein
MMHGQAERLPRRVWFGLGLAALLLAWVAWRVLTLGLADHLAKTDPGAALVWRAGQPEAQFRRGENQVRSGDTAAGHTAAARAAIRSAPLDGRGYRLLARQAETSGNLTAATTLYTLAAFRGPRDLPSLGWLTEHALARGDHARALTHIDRILRVQPELGTQLYPVLMALSAQEPVQGDVAKILLEGPPWRAGFVVQMIQKSPDSTQLFGLIERLRRSPAGLSERELSAWLDRLVRDRHWATAYLTWVNSLPPEYRARIGNVYNGSFELQPSNSGFDWRLLRVSGARVSRSQVTGAGGSLALQVAFEDRRVPFQHVRQLLALAPGTYRLQGRVRLDDLRSERGLVWTLTCAEDGRLISETEPMSGRGGWRTFELDLVVPSTDCGGQWLTLRVPARIAAEQRIGGVAWFDDLQIASSHRPVLLSEPR